MKKLFISGVLFTFLSFVGCSNSYTTPKTQEKEKILTIEQEVGTSSNYIEELGYDVVNYTNTKTHSISPENINSYKDSSKWELQKFNITDYLNQEIGEYSFKVKNHPLDSLKSNSSKITKISIFVYNDKIIGGYAEPLENSENEIFSIDGKKATEVFNKTSK